MITAEVVAVGVSARDAAFCGFARLQRMMLLGSGYLLLGDARLAQRRVEVVLANAYRDWPRLTDPQRTCFAALSTAPTPRPTPWQGRDRMELIDGQPARREPPDDIVADLAALAEQDRRLVVLTWYAELSPTLTADLAGIEADQLEGRLAAAQSALATQDPTRADDRQLAAELRVAVQHRALAPDDPVDDLAHGRMLVSRRRLRRGLVAAAMAVVLVVLAAQWLPGPDRTSVAGAPPTPTGRPTCSVSDTGCRVESARAWRNTMARVSRAYLDPHDRYFTGYSYSYDPSYDSDALWAGRGGALGLDLFRLENGATEVFLQIATGPAFAPRCGDVTHQGCVVMTFPDGTQFQTTRTGGVDDGMEVQYSPRGTEVITVGARNVSAGVPVDITREQLLDLVQDPRLRLPPR